MGALDEARNLQTELAALLAAVGMSPDDEPPAPVSALAELDVGATAEPELARPRPIVPDDAGVTVKVTFLNPASRGDDDARDLASGTDRWTMRTALGELLDRWASTLHGWQHFAQVRLDGGGVDHDQMLVDLLVEAIRRGIVILPMARDRALWRAAVRQYSTEFAGKGQAGAEEARTLRNRWVAALQALHGPLA